jgi:hypothetical protein
MVFEDTINVTVCKNKVHIYNLNIIPFARAFLLALHILFVDRRMIKLFLWAQSQSGGYGELNILDRTGTQTLTP